MTPAADTPITVEHCLDHLRALPAVHAISRCGSFRQGTDDAFSDLDIWVFCDNDAPLSEELAITRFLPDRARREVLLEERDDTLAEHLVLNVLTDRVILNLKFLRTRVLTDFCARPPTLDPAYLEDLENYWTMQALHDPHDVVADHRSRLARGPVGTTSQWLAPEIVARYASTYWRSVYQGVLRTEDHAWRHLAGHLVELLTWAAFLDTGRLPPPRKWLFSPLLLAGVPGGDTVAALLDRIRHMELTDRASVVDFYCALVPPEDLVLTGIAPLGPWWRSVFTHRLPNLAALPGMGDMAAVVAATGGIVAEPHR